MFGIQGAGNVFIKDANVGRYCSRNVFWLGH
jgi:hypothetical protein